MPMVTELAASRDLDTLRKVRREALQAAAAIPESGSAARTTMGADRDHGLGFRRPSPRWFRSAPARSPIRDSSPADNGANLRLFKTRGEALPRIEGGVQSLLLLTVRQGPEIHGAASRPPGRISESGPLFRRGGRVRKNAARKPQGATFPKKICVRKRSSKPTPRPWSALFSNGPTLCGKRSVPSWTLISIFTRRSIRSKSRTRRTRPSPPSAPRSGKRPTGSCRRIFWSMFGIDRLAQLARFLRALRLRAERAQNDPEKDRRERRGRPSFRRNAGATGLGRRAADGA